MIQSIEIQGLKCFDKVQLTFSGFTLLAGRNSTGKSTVIQAILAMFQESASSLAGPYMNIGTVSEVKNRIAGSKEIDLEIRYEYQGEQFQFGKKFLDDKREVHRGNVFPESMKVLYLTADRIGVQDTYDKSLKDTEDIGIRCEYAFYYLCEHARDKLKESDFIYDHTAKLTFGGQVDYWLNRILGYRVTAEQIAGTELIRVAYSNEVLGRDIRPKNVGTGVSYIAEIIIAALSCRKGDLLIIENPEIHLHPSGQAEFISFVVFLAKQGLQVMMETHSDHIYNGLRRCISSDVIDADQVRVYFFEQDAFQNSIPVRICLDEDGHVENQQKDAVLWISKRRAIPPVKTGAGS
ncbi:MAG: AAA family ATPase [Lachnospiraceae bacterium]|nr:AAA family ATPase [Lachnospiraceae bacterium]